jgi:hypothetical protein
MATYYKYAEQEADSQINWAEIGKNLSDTLAEANDLREKKKTAIDTATREYSKTLANAPQGENGLVNQRTLEFANNATEMMLMQERLLKSGQMKFKDYATVRQNLLDSTDQAFGLAKEYQEEYTKKMERLESGISSGLEQWEMEQLEGYANLSGMNFYIDPTTGNVSMGKVLKKNIDGQTVDVMDDNPNNYVAVNTARNRLKSYHDKFKVEESLQEAAKMLGTNVEAIRKSGGAFRAGEIITTTDVTKKKDVDGAINLYNEAEKNFISSRLANDYNVQSVLIDHEKFDPVTGEAYTYTFDPKEQSSNVILMKTENGRTVVDKDGKYYKEQYGVAEKYMQQQLRIMLDREVKRDTYTEPYRESSSSGGSGSGAKKYDKFGINVYEQSNNALRTGNVQNIDQQRYKVKWGQDKEGKNYISFIEKKYDEDLGEYIVPEGADWQVAYKADQVAQLLKGVNGKDVVPSTVYHRGKDDYKNLRGNYLPGTYDKYNYKTSPYSDQGAGDSLFEE